MAKPAMQYVCQECGASYKKWAGQCSNCNGWNTIIEEIGARSFTKVKEGVANTIEFTSLKAETKSTVRKETGIAELDRVLGGGLVEGSAILIGGDPGIGKSTLLLQMATFLAKGDTNCTYITGEESIEQIRLRAKRLGIDDTALKLAAATSVGDILASMQREKPDVIIIDSIQTMYLDSIESAPGTVSQVRTCAFELINLAKQTGAVVLLVGHVTKEGQIAGPKVLEHMVDTVLYFEGERGNQFRLLRAVKNRYGGVNEVGVFEMTDSGLQEVVNPSSLFISGKPGEVSGSVIFSGIEGTRPMLLEIQALVAPSYMASPRRAVVGWDVNRLSMILAVLNTRCGINLSDKEVYLNVVGGMRITEPAADLAVAAAIISALSGRPFQEKAVVFGEIGLSGEVRPVAQAEDRIKEAEKLGFTQAIVPPGLKTSRKDFILTPITYIKQLDTAMSGK